MTKADIESLRQPSARIRIQKLRDVHHQICRLAATGMRNVDIATTIGYNQQRISVILGSPAAQELIAKYRADVDDSWRRQVDIDMEDMSRLRRKTRRILEDMVDDHEETPISGALALKIHDSMADRDGHHRKSTKENINVNFAAQLEAAFARSKQIRYIDGEE